MEKEPFSEIKQPLTLMKKISENVRPVLPIPDTPRQLNSLIASCWQQEPTARPTIADIIVPLRDLQRWMINPTTSNHFINLDTQSTSRTSMEILLHIRLKKFTFPTYSILQRCLKLCLLEVKVQSTS